jgi:methyltransferase (TIGR00027 family)
MDSPIKDVSDTAFWIAHHRRLETERSDALFQDPFAAKLAGERGRRISEAMPTSRVVAWTVALRTRIIDEYLQLAIDSGVDTVVSLGAGLDARPYRMKLPASLHWIEADYPQILEYKTSQLQADKPCCQLERVQIDLADRERRRQLLARINAQAHGILVLTEGLIPYLDNDEVASLADDLVATSQVRFWIVDYFSAEAQKYRNRRGIGRAMQNAPFKFRFLQTPRLANEGDPLFHRGGRAPRAPFSGALDIAPADGALAALVAGGAAAGDAQIRRLCAARASVLSAWPRAAGELDGWPPGPAPSRPTLEPTPSTSNHSLTAGTHPRQLLTTPVPSRPVRWQHPWVCHP